MLLKFLQACFYWGEPHINGTGMRAMVTSCTGPVWWKFCVLKLTATTCSTEKEMRPRQNWRVRARSSHIWRKNGWGSRYCSKREDSRGDENERGPIKVEKMARKRSWPRCLSCPPALGLLWSLRSLSFVAVPSDVWTSNTNSSVETRCNTGS